MIDVAVDELGGLEACELVGLVADVAVGLGVGADVGDACGPAHAARANPDRVTIEIKRQILLSILVFSAGGQRFIDGVVTKGQLRRWQLTGTALRTGRHDSCLCWQLLRCVRIGRLAAISQRIKPREIGLST